MDRRLFLSSMLGAFAPVRILAQEASARGKGLNLKITGLKTFVVNAGSLNWVFCKIYTNGGLVGLGEGSVTSKEATIAQAIMEHERFLVGKDPTDIEFLWQSMFRNPRWRGGPILNSAISAVEIALWDILGQALGGADLQTAGRRGAQPHPHVPGRRVARRRSSCAPRNSATRPPRRRRFRRRTTWSQPTAMIRDARAQDSRRSARPSATISISRWTRTAAAPPPWRSTSAPAWRTSTCCSSRSRPSSKTWASLAFLREKTKTHLATGERSFTKYGFADFCSRHLVDYVQPDVCHAGGILELKKIGVLAETYRVNLAPHNPQSYVSTMASLHVDATTPSASIQEYTLNRTPWVEELFDGDGAGDQGRLRGTARRGPGWVSR